MAPSATATSAEAAPQPREDLPTPRKLISPEVGSKMQAPTPEENEEKIRCSKYEEYLDLISSLLHKEKEKRSWVCETDMKLGVNTSFWTASLYIIWLLYMCMYIYIYTHISTFHYSAVHTPCGSSGANGSHRGAAGPSYILRSCETESQKALGQCELQNSNPWDCSLRGKTWLCSWSRHVGFPNFFTTGSYMFILFTRLFGVQVRDATETLKASARAWKPWCGTPCAYAFKLCIDNTQCFQRCD